MRDDTMMITIPAKLLNELTALAGGYTMSRGKWLNKNSITNEANNIIYDAGYEYWQDERLF
jgi:hypothetical protein